MDDILLLKNACRIHEFSSIEKNWKDAILEATRYMERFAYHCARVGSCYVFSIPLIAKSANTQILLKKGR